MDKLHYSNIGNKLSDFKIIKELGKGSYGTVYTVRSYIDDNVYVMKKMELNNLKEKQQRECYREVSILKKVSHQNIIKYYSSFLDNGVLYIIMEYAEGGDLYSLIKHYKHHNKTFSEFDIWQIAYEMLNGLSYLHKNNIIHRDIKCLNLFITKDKHIKIGDLGVSTIVSNINALHCTRVGTPLYLSPELVKQVPYDFKVDMWSCGCSLYHLACLDPPFTGDNLIVLGNNIVKTKQKELPKQYSAELGKFIDVMLSKRPEKRPSAKEGLEMIPKDIFNKIKIAQDNNVDIKTRPFSAAGTNKVIAYNKEEIFKDESKDKNKVDNEQKKNDLLLTPILEIEKDEVIHNKKETIIKEKEPKKESKKFTELITNKNGISSNKKELMNVLQDNNNTPQPKTKQVSNLANISHDKQFSYNEYILNTPANSNVTPKINSFRSKKPTNLSASSQPLNLLPLPPSIKTPITNPNQNLNQPSKLIDTSIKKPHSKSDLNNKFNSNGFILPKPVINIEKIDNFILNENNKQKVSKTEENIPVKKSHKNLIVNKDIPSIPEYNFKFPEVSKQLPKPLESMPDIKTNFSRRIYSSKFTRNQLSSAKARPLTATNSRVLPPKMKTKFGTSRPGTAFITRQTKDEDNQKNNIINININLYNIDMNRRFLDPNLNPNNQGNDFSVLMNSKSYGNYIESKNLSKTTLNLKELAEQNNQNEFIFGKIIKTIGHTKKGNKPLTIRDFENNEN